MTLAYIRLQYSVAGIDASTKMTVKPTISDCSSDDINVAKKKVKEISRLFSTLLNIYMDEVEESSFKSKLRMEMSIWQTLRNQFHDYIDEKVEESNILIKSIEKKSFSIDVILYRLEKAADSKFSLDL